LSQCIEVTRAQPSSSNDKISRLDGGKGVVRGTRWSVDYDDGSSIACLPHRGSITRADTSGFWSKPGSSRALRINIEKQGGAQALVVPEKMGEGNGSGGLAHATFGGHHRNHGCYVHRHKVSDSNTPMSG
jgi:hypothetical protein